MAESREWLELKNKVLINILREIKMYSESNRLGNSDMFLRKINELASTAIN